MEFNAPLTVVLVDDHTIVREGLREVIEQTGQFRVIGEAADGYEAVSVVSRLKPDLVLLDIIMPGQDGVAACREIMELTPAPRVVVLTASREQDAVIQSLAAGATGYLRKDTNRERLLTTLRDVAEGELRVPAEAVRLVFAELRRQSSPDAVGRAGLTQREHEILIAFVQGLSYSEIAARRSVKPVTIRGAIYGIQEKVGVGNMQALVVWAVRNGVVPEPPQVP